MPFDLPVPAANASPLPDESRFGPGRRVFVAHSTSLANYAIKKAKAVSEDVLELSGEI